MPLSYLSMNGPKTNRFERWDTLTIPARTLQHKPNTVIAMPAVTIKLPEEVCSSLRRSPGEFADELRLAAAIHWYSRGEVSQEIAAAIAGLDRADFLTALAQAHVDVFPVDLNDLRLEMTRDWAPS